MKSINASCMLLRTITCVAVTINVKRHLIVKKKDLQQLRLSNQLHQGDSYSVVEQWPFVEGGSSQFIFGPQILICLYHFVAGSTVAIQTFTLTTQEPLACPIVLIW